MAIDGDGKMDAKKRIPQVRHGINVCPECSDRLLRIKIDTFEWDNPIMFGETEVASDFVRIQAGGVYHVASFNFPRFRENGAAFPPHVAGVLFDPDTFRDRIGPHAFDDPQRIRRGCGRRKDCSFVRFCTWLDLAHLIRRDGLKRHAIDGSPPGQLVELRQLGSILCHDKFAAFINGNLFAFAVRHEKAIAVPREFRLEGIGGIIKTGVDHPAIAPAGVQSAGGFLLKKANILIGVASLELTGDGDADDSPSYDQEIRTRHAGIHGRTGVEEGFKITQKKL